MRHGVLTPYQTGVRPPSLNLCSALTGAILVAKVPEYSVILLVEDREDDIVIVRRALVQAHLVNPLHVVRDGEEAIEYLSGTGKYANREEFPLPGLILLDLKMPRVDGFQVLEWIRKQPGLKGIVVLVLTSSDQLRDVNRAYALGASSFLVKPVDFEDYIELGNLLRKYWINTAKLPVSFRPPLKPNDKQHSG
jgi:CheY-like chemotaxis protein